MATSKREVKMDEGARESNANTPGKQGFRGKFKPAAVQEPKFQGNCDSHQGFVCNCSDGRQSDRYILVMKDVVEYVGRDYAYGGDIRWTIENEAKFANLEDKPIGVNKRI
jgi:hypothetical protein